MLHAGATRTDPSHRIGRHVKSRVPARAESYEAVPYPGHAYQQTHPDHLAAIATLFGASPAAVDRCRVLEIGCGDAVNLLAMAITLPNTRFVGLDLSAAAIARGRQYASQLNIGNLDLMHADLCDLQPEAGTFDYIIAHGLYSWVPSAVRDRLMAIVSRHLAREGVAFISYNVYPGAYARRMLREMMLYHVEAIADPDGRVEQALAFANAIARATPDDDETKAVLGPAIRRLAGLDPAALVHDDLADVNDPVYFHEFARHAETHGLQFLAEADLFEMADEAVPDDLKTPMRRLAEAGDVVRREQLLDFFKGRQFRQTLVCHSERRLDAAGAPARVRRLRVSAPLTPASSGDDDVSPDTVRYTTSRGSSVATSDPLAKAALAALVERYPERLEFDALLAEARDRAHGAYDAGDDEHLARVLWTCGAAGIVSFHTVPAPLVRVPGPRPEAAALARLQVREHPDVSSLVHRTVRIADPEARALLPLLDGTRDRAALAAEWSAQPAMLDECLAGFGRMALLVR